MGVYAACLFGLRKKETYTKALLEKRIRKVLDNDSVEIDVKSINYWRMSAQIAATYRKHRVLLVGDAAHRFPPTGGLGMNTGIADAHNVAWKLQAVINGLTDEEFLDTYEVERKSIAEQNCEESLYNYHKILEVIEAFGLERDGLRKLAKFKNMAPLKWLPTAWLDKIILFGAGMVQRKMNRFYTDTGLREKVLATIADQVAHFDRIGLDIGYSYEQGAIIPDGTDLVVPEDRVTQYIPSARPGARFPHIDFYKSTFPTSSHDLFDYRNFTLFIRSEGADWANGVTQISASIQQIVKVVQLDKLGLSEKAYDTLVSLCEIEKNGALLIRPDGHVAWRARTLKGNAVEEFTTGIRTHIQKQNKCYIVKVIKYLAILIVVLLSLAVVLGLYLNRGLPNKIIPADFNCLSLDQGTFRAFDTLPSHIYGIGLAYAGHINETASDFDPDGHPPVFIKASTSIIKNGSQVKLPSQETMIKAVDALEPGIGQQVNQQFSSLPALLDYEVELGFVLLEDIPVKDLENDNYAPKIGFFIGNDLSARSLAILGEGQSNRYDYWGVSKSFSGFTPISDRVWVPDEFEANSIPCIIIETEVNGLPRQRQMTSDLIYTPLQMLQFILSKYPDTPLQKGDIVLTGTPGGVIMSTPRWLVRLAESLEWIVLINYLRSQVMKKKMPSF